MFPPKGLDSGLATCSRLRARARETSHSGLVHRLGKAARCQSLREFKSLRLRKFSKRVSEPKIWSARSAVCSAFPPQNPESERIRHAPRGSKSTVRSLI